MPTTALTNYSNMKSDVKTEEIFRYVRTTYMITSAATVLSSRLYSVCPPNIRLNATVSIFISTV